MSEESPRRHYAWFILTLATLVVFASLGLGRFGYTMVLPAMQVSLGLDNTHAGALATANLIGYLALSVLGGALASQLGPRVVITAGLAVSGLAMILTASASGFAATALWRALTGVGGGASNVPAMGLLAAWFAARRRGLASGVAVAGSSLALIVLGPTVPRVLATYGPEAWRACWVGFGVVALTVAAMAGALLRNRPAQLGLEPVGADPGGAFAPAGSTARWGDVYRSWTVWHLGLVYMTFGFSYIIYMTFFVKALVTAGGYTQAEAGRLFMIMGWCSLPCGIIWGSLSDRFGRQRALVAVYLQHALAFGLFGLIPHAWAFTLSAILFGLGAWSIPAIMAAACGDMLGPRLAPAALGFITLFFGLGQALGPLVAGRLADAQHSLLPTMTLASGVALVGAIATAFLRPHLARERL